MARARNIKPAFFTDEIIADNDPLARILYIGLWTIADFNGNIEWRPKRIKIQLLPYDDCDIEQLAINLDKSRLVTFYSVNNKCYLNIANFTKHQNPHPNEKKKGTDIPLMPQVTDSIDVTINHDLSRQVSEDSISDPADSCFLIPYTDRYTDISQVHKKLVEAGLNEKWLIRVDDRKIMQGWIDDGLPEEILINAIS